MEFNLYENSLSQSQHGIHATRWFLLLFVLGLLVLTIQMLLISQRQTGTIHMPTSWQVETLHQQEFSTLSCECQRNTISYSTIIRVRPRYHQICGSPFLDDDQWLKYFEFLWNATGSGCPFTSHQNDFRVYGLYFFHQLRTLCQLIDTVTNNELQAFNQTQLWSEQTLTREEFTLRTNIIMQRFS